jgi:hypothetical protein
MEPTAIATASLDVRLLWFNGYDVRQKNQAVKQRFQEHRPRRGLL